jgi:hypothetical protein
LTLTLSHLAIDTIFTGVGNITLMNSIVPLQQLPDTKQAKNMRRLGLQRTMMLTLQERPGFGDLPMPQCIRMEHRLRNIQESFEVERPLIYVFHQMVDQTPPDPRIPD